ncbi:OsmC family peroxiredoxin [Cryptosporangium aurantiacum]|uniref:Osmotically inducible protein OsmC n=1 Tax=Cryptosporangium aurantiacum TaxID=134849 RepID=A0A1M7RE12_9ACTN|nr:OsmC family peroxiredoxin [Cryptosporangium aurantiacum]SHN44505.1 osmotically inducible protein OsmC [Cryptosporangium aurantiacum]
MALTSTATAHWEGSLFEGKGSVNLDSSRLGSFDINWKARSEGQDSTTTPEELLGAAHAACFSMAFSNGLAKAGTPPTALNTTADVTFVPGTGITGIKLTVRGDVPGISADDFAAAAADAKANCPVSKALAGVEITLDAALA